MIRDRRQLRLEVDLWLVRADGFVEQRVQARSAAAAKYQVFRRAREAGYFSDARSGFRDFLARGFVAVKLRRHNGL